MTSPLLTNVQNTNNSIQGGDWQAPGVSGAGGDISGLGNVTNPLMAIVEAGFSFIMPFIQFLDEALPLLAGNPGAITSSAQNLDSTGQSVSSLAGNYQQAATNETTGWIGPAAVGYQGASTDQTTGQAALGQSSSGLSSATTGGAAAVASTLAQVTSIIAAAAGEIITIISTAAASSESSFGATMAAAILQSVATAAAAAGMVAAKMGTLLSSAQNLAGLVQSLLSAVNDAEQLITKFTQSSTSGVAAPAQVATA